MAIMIIGVTASMSLGVCVLFRTGSTGFTGLTIKMAPPMGLRDDFF